MEEVCTKERGGSFHLNDGFFMFLVLETKGSNGCAEFLKLVIDQILNYLFVETSDRDAAPWFARFIILKNIAYKYLFNDYALKY